MYRGECKSIGSVPIMVGFSDSNITQMLVSEKISKDEVDALNPLGFELFVQECRITRNSNSDRDEEEGEEDHDGNSEQLESQEDNFDMFVSSLTVRIPSTAEEVNVVVEEEEEEEEDSEGQKTPTSSDSKIRVSLQCPPPAPRKPKSLPLKKRKLAGRPHPRLILDISTELESLFPPVAFADLCDARTTKKARQGSDNDHTTS